MQTQTIKWPFDTENIKYTVAALGIAGALAAGVTTYTITRDDSQASQSVAAAPALKSHYVERAGEGAISGNAAVTSDVEVVRPTLREGFQANGPGDDFASPSPKARGVPSVTTRDDITAYTPFGAGEGILGGNESADLSYLAPEVRSWAEIVLLEQNGVFDLAVVENASTGMLTEEYTQHNPGAVGVDSDTITAAASSATTANGISSREWQLFYEANVLDAVAAEAPTVTWETMRFLEQNQLPDAGTSATSLSDQVPHHLHFTP